MTASGGADAAADGAVVVAGGRAGAGAWLCPPAADAITESSPALGAGTAEERTPPPETANSASTDTMLKNAILG
ncbi:MAG: hypothetical protein WC273_01640 [Dehalococcoidia bacterium]